MRKSGLGNLAGILLGAASVSQLGGCGTFSSQKEKGVDEIIYRVQTNEGDERPVRYTLDKGAREQIELGFYDLRKSGIEGVDTSYMMSASSDEAHDFVKTWIDKDGDSHISMYEAEIFNSAMHIWIREKTVPEEFLRAVRKVELSREDYTIGSKR